MRGTLSGYAPDAALHETSVSFVAKPFLRTALVETVRGVLAAPRPRSQGRPQR
jgi:hypothetical protein